MKKLILCVLFSLSFPLDAIVGSVFPGQSLWRMVKQIGQTSDIIESKLDALKACEETIITSADISGGTITISNPGTYRLGEDVTATISIQSSCVLLDLNNRILTGNIVVTASNINVTIENGTVIGTDNTGISLDGFSQIVRNVIVHMNAQAASAGRDAILVNGVDDALIIGCTVRGGNGGTLGGGAGASGGSGIVLSSAKRCVVRDCIVYSGSGGNAALGGGSGGDAGHGIDVGGSSSDVEIDGCIIMATGAGGDNSVSGTNGDGGHGIRVANTCADVAVHDCIIRNTGAGGTGLGLPATKGKAIFDSVTTAGSLSVFLRNFAHNIANTIKYDFQNEGTEKGTQVANPPDNTVLSEPNQFVNAYMS